MAYKIAYQLYSSRLFPPLEAQLPELKAMGYDAIEPWLPAYEADPGAFRRAMDDAGLDCYGFHMPLTGLVAEPERFIDIALTLGARWMIPPYIAPEDRGQTPEFWRQVGAQLAAGAERAAPHGLKIAWHNHDFEFVPLPDGSLPITHLLDAAGPDVGFEVDFAWVVRAGADPEAVLDALADRITIIQMKDTAPLGTVEEGGWAPTGDGIIDWPALIGKFAGTRADHLVTEHDNPADWRRFAKRSIDYLRAQGL